MKPKIIINRIGAQDRLPTYDTFLTKDILDDICNRLIHTNDYDVEWCEKRNKGRLIILETSEEKFYINLSQTGELRARNYQIQSVPTAFSSYLKDSNKLMKKSSFWFYFLPFKGNNATDYLSFSYRLMKTIGIKFLNPDKGLGNEEPSKYLTVKDLILSRNDLRQRNSGNKSTYITDEGDCYHIYGKTFGANQKETTMFCLAVLAITDKPVKLFQILDNESDKLSKDDVDAILNYSSCHNRPEFDVLDDTFEFDGDDSDSVKDNLRSPRFLYNLLSKFNGEKKCALCGCKIESIIQAAHIYPVADIRKRTDLNPTIKLQLAVDGDNGIWLCENHHKMFDSGLIWFEDGKLCVSDKLSGEDLIFIKKVTTIDKLDPRFVNDRMLAYFDSRNHKSPRVALP